MARAVHMLYIDTEQKTRYGLDAAPDARLEFPSWCSCGMWLGGFTFRDAESDLEARDRARAAAWERFREHLRTDEPVVPRREVRDEERPDWTRAKEPRVRRKVVDV